MAVEQTGSIRAKSMAFTQSLQDDDGLKALRYEETMPAKPPIPVTVAPPRVLPTDTHPALRDSLRSVEDQDATKRDSGLAPTTSTRDREDSLNIPDNSSLASTAKVAMDAQIAETANVKKADSDETSNRRLIKQNKKDTPKTPDSHTSNTSYTSESEFTPITTPIPSDNLLDLDFIDQISFSNRGSVLLGGKKAINSRARLDGDRRLPAPSILASPPSALPPDVEKESLKVRSLYDTGLTGEWSNDHLSPLGEADRSERCSLLELPGPRSFSDAKARPETAPDLRRQSLFKSEHELAGGIEDWEDVHGADVDRYGFITRTNRSAIPESPDSRRPQRTSTVLHSASESPRKQRGFGRALSSSRSARSGALGLSRKASARSLNTGATSGSQRMPIRPYAFRSAANRLPGNRNRRWMDEAGDMLTLPPGLAEIAADNVDARITEEVKRKESDRTEKWRKMARLVRSGDSGGGMVFEFDARNPKLIERTWKGIPDRWRATAWHSFLNASAKRDVGSPTDEHIIIDFHRLLDQSSAEDVQIDMDVPRTINSHIMFRKRYRGGQRLLFRVLHCISLYFPETGYVQGMASLAATLLCYYDEEQTFVMMVRLWQLRGLKQLYAPGFKGLMSALDEFQKDWMDGHDVSKKLDGLGIDPTAYGTRWYLTIFNYSMPFAAQLRVWDVFMLLGDRDYSIASTEERPFAGGLDVLHAASAAIIDGTRDILLDSDFENSMKCLTSWIPIKDEELFMRVAKAEWKLHRGKRQS